MHHLAILSKKPNFLDLILNKKKTIESRWYKTKKTPYNQIKKGDTIFLKNSGEKVTAKATVTKVLQYDNLNKTKIKQILKLYGKQIGIKYSKNLEKNYCILIFLKNPKKITPFQINKKGYGLMSAWITLPDIKKLTFINNFLAFAAVLFFCFYFSN